MNMNMFFTFWLIFFGIVGVVQTANFIYANAVRLLNCIIYRQNKKEEKDIKIWMKT